MLLTPFHEVHEVPYHVLLGFWIFWLHKWVLDSFISTLAKYSVWESSAWPHWTSAPASHSLQSLRPTRRPQKWAASFMKLLQQFKHKLVARFSNTQWLGNYNILRCLYYHFRTKSAKYQANVTLPLSTNDIGALLVFWFDSNSPIWRLVLDVPSAVLALWCQ